MKPESFNEPPSAGVTAGDQPATHPRYRWGRLLVVLVVLALLVWAAIALFGKHDKPVPPPQPVQATLAKVVTSDVAIYQVGVGTAMPLQSVTVKARVDGQLQKLGYTEGQDVKAGQLIAQIDPRPFQATLAQLMAQKARDEALLANAKLDLSRYNDLIKDEATSKQTLDTQKALVQQDEAAIKNDDAQISGAKTQLDYTTITAPISGRTGLRLVDVGNIVHASDTTGLVVIDQIDPIAVIFTLPDAAFQRVNAAIRSSGTPLVAVAYSRDDASKPLAKGALLLVDNHIDTTSGTVQIKARFEKRLACVVAGPVCQRAALYRSAQAGGRHPCLGRAAQPEGDLCVRHRRRRQGVDAADPGRVHPGRSGRHRQGLERRAARRDRWAVQGQAGREGHGRPDPGRGTGFGRRCGEHEWQPGRQGRGQGGREQHGIRDPEVTSR